jgi:hypothetical protein
LRHAALADLECLLRADGRERKAVRRHCKRIQNRHIDLALRETAGRIDPEISIGSLKLED